ncbi:MAG TPA: hypothetical protein VKJ45_05670 [Blastocatellia bacterium]|nr:hypothetical protein [Blastocatellia bacterium]
MLAIGRRYGRALSIWPVFRRLEGGPTITVAGATVDFEPGTLNLRSNGRFVEATIEVENRGAATINVASLMLQVGGVLH